MSKTWAGGSTRAWRRIRALVLQRDRAAGWACRAHEEGWCARANRASSHACTTTPTSAHHTRGKSVTGDDPRYLVASCSACNLHIGDPTTGADPSNEGVTKW